MAVEHCPDRASRFPDSTWGARSAFQGLDQRAPGITIKGGVGLTRTESRARRAKGNPGRSGTSERLRWPPSREWPFPASQLSSSERQRLERSADRARALKADREVLQATFRSCRGAVPCCSHWPAAFARAGLAGARVKERKPPWCCEKKGLAAVDSPFRPGLDDRRGGHCAISSVLNRGLSSWHRVLEVVRDTGQESGRLPRGSSRSAEMASANSVDTNPRNAPQSAELSGIARWQGQAGGQRASGSHATSCRGTRPRLGANQRKCREQTTIRHGRDRRRSHGTRGIGPAFRQPRALVPS